MERATPQCSVPPALAALARTDVVQSGERERELEREREEREREMELTHGRSPLAVSSHSRHARLTLYTVSPVRWSHVCLPTFGIAGSGGTSRG